MAGGREQAEHGHVAPIGAHAAPDQPVPLRKAAGGIPEVAEQHAQPVADRAPHGVDACELADGTASDCDTNGVIDDCELADGSASDSDFDGLLDLCELDSDSDGTIDDCDPDMYNGPVLSPNGPCLHGTGDIGEHQGNCYDHIDGTGEVLAHLRAVSAEFIEHFPAL